MLSLNVKQKIIEEAKNQIEKCVFFFLNILQCQKIK